MRKPRPDSLYARLDNLGKLDEFFAGVYRQHISIEKLVEQCTVWGAETSTGAVCLMIQNHGMTWKIRAANEEAERRIGALPTDADAKILVAKKQIEFDLAYTDLTTKERLALLKYFEGKEAGRREDRRIAILEKKAAQADATEKVLSDDQLSPEQRQQRIREIYGRA